ncbi:hypothetical protein MHC_02420 [Mycoplasma haemocanis str. Illinois]|uniref:Uncharacterized protein n=1 Tax=Mycoplasma haemocanis (strain Illinois) TaxID=1111676 RepID=H6N6S6_MYCHN|nr:hypothetical protein [Mycoplasma haemocanis]AEW45348.1 hypothetical protein MHC_02420 [Mycoplasma haemocanis str. Illinois]
MNSLLFKGSVVAVSASGITAAGVYFSGVLKTEDKSFKAYLTKIGRTAAAPEDWNKIKELYSKETSDSPIPNIPKSSVSSDVNLITRWCEDKLKQEHSKSEEDLVETWCAKPVNVESRLSYFNLSSLDVSETASSNKDDSTWTSKVSNYGKDTADASLKVKEINDSSGQKVEGSEISSTIEASKLRKWCGWAKDQTYQNKGTDLFKKYKHWCTKPKNS